MYAIRLPTLVLVTACSHELATSGGVEIVSASPDVVCNGAAVSTPNGITTVALSGRQFTPMPSRALDTPRLLLPQVTLVAQTGAAIEIVDDPDDPEASHVHWVSETAMSFDVTPADALPTGVFDVAVTNPDGSASVLDRALAIVASPIVALPTRICDGGADQSVIVSGSGFLAYDAAMPVVAIAGPAGTKTFVPSLLTGCVAISGALAEHVQLCTGMTIAIPQGELSAFANASVTLVVTNPAPADCVSSPPLHITIEMSPCRA